MIKPVTLIFAATAFCFSSCQFGHSAEEIMNKYSDVERNIEFTFSSPTPGGTTRVSMTDNGLEGVATSWENSDAIALFDFGEVFVEPTNAISLAYDKGETSSAGLSVASFKGEAKAKMGENVFDGKEFALLYPYSKFADKEGSTESVDLDFTGQDGILSTLSEKYLYAWGGVYGECSDAVVTLKENQSSCSSNQDWHNHETGSETIVLDNKMCIIRFSMVSPDGKQSLTDYLKANNLELDQIVVECDETSTPFSKATVDLKTGEVKAAEDASCSLTVEVGTALTEITEEDATPVSLASDADKVAWGTTFYLAVPCTESGSLLFYPVLTIKTKTAAGASGTTYYGSLASKTLKEGDYYMTAPIQVSDNKMNMQEDAQIFLYYHSSYVFDIVDIY